MEVKALEQHNSPLFCLVTIAPKSAEDSSVIFLFTVNQQAKQQHITLLMRVGIQRLLCFTDLRRANWTKVPFVCFCAADITSS